MFDNLFGLLGVPGTSLILFGILAAIGVAPLGAMLFPEGVLGQRQYRNRV